MSSNSSSIGRGSLDLSVNGAGLNSGLSAVTGKLSSWGESTKGLLKTKMGGVMSGALSGLKGGIAGLAAGFGLSAFDGALDKIKELSTVGKGAKALGIDSAQYMGLANTFKKVGLEGTEFQSMLGKLGAKITGTALNGGELAATFKSMDLDAKELAKLPIDQQLLKVSDAIAKLPPGGQQATAAMKLFEEAGTKLLPVLGQGSEKIQAMIDKQKKMGTALGQEDMNKLMKAQSALPKLGQVWEGFKNKSIVAIAPIIEMIGGKLSSVVEGLMPIFDWVSRGLAEHWGIIADGIGDAISIVWDFGKSVVDAVKELFNFSDSTMSIGDVVESVWKFIAKGVSALGTTIAKVFGAITYGASYLVDAFSGVLTALKAVVDMGKSLPDAMRPAWLGDFSSSIDSFDKKVRNAADGMRAYGNRQMGKQYGTGFAGVDAWFANRKNKEEVEEFGEDFGKCLEPAMKAASHKAASEFSGAFAKGSKEAYSIEINRDLGAQLSAQQKQADALLQIKALGDEQKKLLQKIVDQGKNLPAIGAI